MTRIAVSSIAGLSFFVALAAPCAHATPITFDFNALSDGAKNGKVRSYMNGVLGSAGHVNVSGSRAEKNYTGDGHVVGPVTNNTVKSETLGTSDLGVHHGGPLDAFLINKFSDRITMTFSFRIYAVSFDYEIFPNGSCRNAGHCSSWPDLTFEADDQVVFQKLGVVPPVLGYTHSPHSGPSANELTPQLIGQSSNWLFPNGVTKLEFIDWPVRIGIDNLVIDGTQPGPGTSVPEPGTLLLLGSGLTAAWIVRPPRRRG